MADPPLRTCTRCGQTDDAPRDVIAVPEGQPLVNFHIDCHAQLGCARCLARVASADGAQGDELRAHLLSLPKEG